MSHRDYIECMKPVKNLVTFELLEELASRSNFRYGRDIVKSGTITMDTVNAFHVVARVAFHGGQTRTVDVLSTPKGLRFKCTCTARKDLFCNHCVAVGLTLLPKEAEE